MSGTVPKSAKRRQPKGGSRKGIPKVTSIQHDAEANRRPVSRARDCNDIEMRNIETAAARISVSDPRRQEIDRRLSALRAACK